ncbi:transketolase [Streptomyces sp. NPDC057280]|uniref:transketolase n=1 Tax=Streptomyces sp. NPDC057280 TaxID=3346081 RepID=UPI003630E226
MDLSKGVLSTVRDGERAYVHVSAGSHAEPRGGGQGFERVREGLGGVALAVGATIDPVLRATAGLDVTVLYATTVRPFDEIGPRTAVLAADRADVVLVGPGRPGIAAGHVAETLVHVPHRLLVPGAADTHDEPALGRAVREFLT